MKLPLKKVAVTGCIASGKTTVCSYLKEYGAYVVSADGIVHRILSPETVVGKKVIASLGANIVKEGKIDRTQVAELVFSDPEKLKSLEEIIHPAVLEEIEREYEQLKNNPTFSFFVAEIPLLYELNWQDYFDHIIAVIANEEICKQRYHTMKEQDDFDKRMVRQLSIKEKRARARMTIINNGSLEDLKQEVARLTSTLQLF